MKKIYLIVAVLCLTSTFAHAALPLVLNSGNPATCGPGGLTGNNLTNPIGNTIYDTNYTSECYYTSETNHVIQDPGIVAGTSYTLYLHFAEIFFGAGNPNPAGGDGSRIFHVDVEGTRILDNFDIHALVGPSNAIVYRYDVTASTNGSLLISFVPVVQNAKISTIEIRTLGEASSLPPATPIIDLTTPSFPVEWLDLDYRLTGSEVSLSWSTAWEVNNERFDIQMSKDGQVMETIGSIDGSGTSTIPQFYEFTSSLSEPGFYLFRLIQQDFDGQRSYSPLIEVQFEQGALTVLPLEPNPAIDQVLVKFRTELTHPASVELVSLDGRVLRSYQVTPALNTEYRLDIPINGIPMGIYLVVVQTKQGRMIKKLIVSR